jgi:hypothetical protein
MYNHFHDLINSPLGWLPELLIDSRCNVGAKTCCGKSASLSPI